MLCCSLVLLGTFLGVSAQTTILQSPPSSVQLVGSELALECTVKGTSSPNLYWYRQAPGGAPQLLFTSISAPGADADAETPKHLEASRPKDGQFLLTSKKLVLGDSGLYLCAWSITLSGLVGSFWWLIFRII